MSNQTNLMGALDEFHKICPLVKASKENPYFKSKYADYNIIVTETREPLEKSGLRIKQTISHINEVTAIRTKLTHQESGESIEDLMPVVHKPNDPQAQGSGITYAKRYSYVAMLDLLVDQDDDGELSNRLTEASKKSEQIDVIIDLMKMANSLDDLKKAFANAGSLMTDKRIIRAKNARKAELENADN